MIEVFTKKDRSQGARDAAFLARQGEIERNARREQDELVRETVAERHRQERDKQAVEAMTRADGEQPIPFAERVLTCHGALVVANGIARLASGKVATPRGKIMDANAILKAKGYPQIGGSSEWLV